MGAQIMKPNVLEQDLSKDIRPDWEVYFKPSKILWILKSFLRAPKTIVGPLQFHSSTQQIYVPVCPKKLWVWNLFPQSGFVNSNPVNKIVSTVFLCVFFEQKQPFLKAHNVVVRYVWFRFTDWIIFTLQWKMHLGCHAWNK